MTLIFKNLIEKNQNIIDYDTALSLLSNNKVDIFLNK